MVVNNVPMQSPQKVYIHYETTNQSFLDMHYYLKEVGIQNNEFFLVLYDPGLAGIDPRDPNLSPMMKQRVLRECCANYWYFLREVVRVPVSGGGGGGSRYKLNRGNLAYNFLAILNYNIFLELPRQFGKTTAALCRYLWCYNFGTSNSEIAFFHKDHNGSKSNLKDLKEIRDMLPSYLQMSASTGIDGKKLKVPNTIVTMQHPINNNKIITFPSARAKDAADRLGRGATMPMEYYDEFGFMPYNQIVYSAAVPAFSKAAENAKAHGSPYGLLITTTPGDLTTEEGTYAFNVRNAATVWNDAYYDRSYEELEALREANTNTSFFLIRFTYLQLGAGEEYFKRMVVQMQKDWPKIRREILLEWTTAASNCAFKQDDLDKIKELCKEPIRTLFFGKAKQYQFLVYEDIDLRYPPIIGVDVAGGLYNDSSTITVVDSRTTKAVATLNCNYMPSDDLADVLYTLVTTKMSNGIINMERNGIGVSVLQRLCKTSVKKNLYYEIKDKVIEESFNGVRANRKTARVKVYGTDSSKDVRARMIEILYDRVAYHKDKFVASCIHHELETMVVKRDGKVEHADKCHDDQVFSYLLALYVFYDGQNLMENFGIRKGVLKTDEDVEVVESNIDEEAEKTSNIDMTDANDDDANTDDVEIINTKKFISDSSKYQLARDFTQNSYDQESADFINQMKSDKLLKEAYEKKYHIDGSLGNPLEDNIPLPQSLFGLTDDDDEDPYYNEEYNKKNGNLHDTFININK